MGQMGQPANRIGPAAGGQEVFGQKAAQGDSGDPPGSPQEKMTPGFRQDGFLV